MKRVRRFKLFPIALSVQSLCDALSIERRKIDHAIKYEGLPVYQHGGNRRILVEDAVRWVRETWKRG